MLVKKILIDRANRLYQMPPDILSFLPSEERHLVFRKADLIDLASFQWPIQFDDHQIPDRDGLQPASRERINNLKEEVLEWMSVHRQVKLRSTKDVFVGSGISSLAFTLALAHVDSGDLVFVPGLGVPLYRQVTIACGGEPVAYRISPKNDWQPDFQRLSTRVGRVARLLFLNSPHNPTGTELNEKEMAELVAAAARENILIVNDAAYQSVPSRSPISLLAAEGARKVGVELHSFSYQFGLPPLPFGFAVGSREVLAGMRAASRLTILHLPDFYVTLAIQAMRSYPGEALKKVRRRFAEATSTAVPLLDLLKLERSAASTVPYLWARIEGRRNATTLARVLYRRHRILAAPGTSFGETGQGYLRFSLTAEPSAYQEAAARIRKRAGILHSESAS